MVLADFAYSPNAPADYQSAKQQQLALSGKIKFQLYMIGKEISV